MHGQYRILSEVLLFALGMAIASYVTLSFSSVRDFVGSESTRDKMESVATNIMNSVVKTTQANSVLIIEIPQRISEREYRIKVSASDGECTIGKDCFLNLSADGISVSKQLFNISQNYNIKGDVRSTARFLSISSKPGEIVIGRA